MSPAFTEYIRSLEPGGEPPPQERFEAFWVALRNAMIRELRKRGLWMTSPRCLGIYGPPGWSSGDALEELLVDCYAFIISRLRGLKAQLEQKPDIEGLLALNIQHFLYETQKKHDPLGFRIFKILQAATREAIAEGALFVVEGDPRIRNDTVLAFAPQADAREVAEVASLREPVGEWSDDLLPDLILAFGRGLGRVRSKLKDHILDLGRLGIEAFRFGELIGPLKSEVRARWSAFWQHSEGTVAVEDDAGELVHLVRLVQPDTGFEERESFLRLLACVDENIERLEEPDPARAHLQRLWWYLRGCVAESSQDQPASSRADRTPPSRRRIASLLGIPRNRLTELLATLGRLVEACRADISGKTAVREEEEEVPAGSAGTELS